jgi:hypothetical protein
MNLIALYDSLVIPDEANRRVFNAIPIPEYPNFRVAIDNDGNPVLLLFIKKSLSSISRKNYRLKYLQLEHNLECKIVENCIVHFETFTVLTFISENRHLKEYFLLVSEPLIKSLHAIPTQEHIIDTIDKFVEVFRALNDSPTNTVHGLWTELFFIANSKQPHVLLKYWHNLPEERFDFNAGREKIEVKSSSRLERIHTFSSEQLNPPNDSQVIIASIFIKQDSSGMSIQKLVEKIEASIQDDIELISKLNRVIIKTLGNSLEQSINIKFDFELAKNSLQFYRHQDITKIEEINIPDEVSEVRFKSDMTLLKPVQPHNIKINGLLFDSI